MERYLPWIVALSCFGLIEGAPNRGMVIGSVAVSSIYKVEGPPPVDRPLPSGTLYNLSPSSALITSMDSDYNNNTLFVSEIWSGSIYKLTNFEFGNNNSLEISNIHKGLSIAMISIAFDVSTKNLYWTDQYYNWIAMKPAYSQDPTGYKVLLEHDLLEPAALTVDGYNGYMFFADQWNKTRIERATLAGQERRVIIHVGLIWVASLAVDHVSRTLYWADTSTHAIESTNYDGGNRKRILQKDGLDWSSIDLYGGYLFATSFYTKMLYIVDTVNKTVANSLPLYLDGYASVVHYFDNETSVDFNNTCDYKGCSDMCVHEPTGPTCLCREGSILQNDGVTCSAPSGFYGKGLLFANASSVCMMEIQIISGLKNVTIPCIDIPDVNITSIAADVANHVIFYLDSNNNSLMEYDIIAQKNTYLTSVDDASDLVYDWIDGILLWIERNSNEIKACTLQTKYVTTLYSFAVPIAHLTANPHSRNIFWLSGGGGNETIVVGNFHGGSIKELSLYLFEPDLLYFDITSHRLFWIDAVEVASVLADGTDRKSHTWANYGNSHFLIYKDYAIWVADQVFYASHMDDWLSEISDDNILREYGGISSMIAYDIALQQSEAAPCSIMNGGCEEICLPGDSVPVCKCDLGLRLKADNKTCVSESELLQSDFLLVTDFHHGRALQLSLTNGSMTNTDVKMDRPTASTFDKSRNELLWFEQNSIYIYLNNIYSDEGTKIVTYSFADIVAMDIDYSTGNIYFIANYYDDGFIGVVHPMSSDYKELISPYDEVGDIALYPSKGLMFSSEQGGYGNIIAYSNMDGTDYTEIVYGDDIKPIGLAIDYSTDLIYWTDNLRNVIEYCKLDGSNRQTLTTGSAILPQYLTLSGEHIYYTAAGSQQVLKMDKTSGEHFDFMSDNPELGRLDGIIAVPGILQPIHPLCATRNGNCSTLCLPTSPTTRVCACLDYVDLDIDGRTCTDVTQCPLKIPNGEMDSDCLRYPKETCNYTCNLGYLKNSSIENLDCGLDGEWKMNMSTQDLGALCLVGPPTTTPTPELLCPDSLWNGTLSKTCTRKPNTTCSFTCNPGYPAKDGLNSLECDSQGSWNHDTTNICQPLICPNVVTAGSFRKSCSRLPDTSCLFDCDAGYISTVGMIALHCGFQGSWDRDTKSLCKEHLCPNTVVNGNLSSTCSRMPDTACPLQCAPGYKAKMGLTSLFCDYDGKWNYNTNTVCEPLKCLHNVSNGHLGANCSRDANSTCPLTCNYRYRPDNDVTLLTCGFDGMWSKNVSTVCEQIDCGDVNQPVLLSPGCPTVAGSQCAYQCAMGYRKNTNVNNLTCQDTGTWSSNPANLCTGIVCPEKIPNFGEAILTSCSKTYNAKCEYSCANGYTKNPKLSFVTCLESGNWDTPMYPLCEAVKPEAQKGDDAVVIVGVVAAALFLVVLIAVIGIVCLKRQQKDQQFQRQRLTSLAEEKGPGVYSEIRRSRDVSQKGFQNPHYDNPAFEQKNKDPEASAEKTDPGFTKM